MLVATIALTAFAMAFLSLVACAVSDRIGTQLTHELRVLTGTLSCRGETTWQQGQQRHRHLQRIQLAESIMYVTAITTLGALLVAIGCWICLPFVA